MPLVLTREVRQIVDITDDAGTHIEVMLLRYRYRQRSIVLQIIAPPNFDITAASPPISVKPGQWVVSGRVDDHIRIGDAVDITIVKIRSAHVKLGFTAPNHIQISRREAIDKTSRHQPRC